MKTVYPLLLWSDLCFASGLELVMESCKAGIFYIVYLKYSEHLDHLDHLTVTFPGLNQRTRKGFEREVLFLKPAQVDLSLKW